MDRRLEEDDPEDGQDGVPDDELDPKFLTRHDADFADWRRARLLAERMGTDHLRSAARSLLPPTSPEGDEPEERGSGVGRDSARAVRSQVFGRPFSKAQPTRRADLDAILQAADIDVHELPSAKGHFLAALYREPGEPGAVIFLAPGQTPGRRRFSIAHELGHFFIPAHREVGPQCQCRAPDFAQGIITHLGAAEAVREALRRSMEAEANEFAAELLMPEHIFARDVAKRDISIETALRLADERMYDVSVTAAAWRMVQVTDEACALVSSSSGVVRWAVKSRNFPQLACEKSARLSPESAAMAVARGEPHRVRPERVPSYAWTTRTSGPGRLALESTFRDGAARTVLSLVWMLDQIQESIGSIRLADSGRRS